MDVDSVSVVDSGAPHFSLLVAVIMVVVVVYLSQHLRGGGGDTSAERQLQLDEERRKVRLRQQEELARATAEYKEKHPADSTSATTPKQRAPYKPKPPPGDLDSGYNPLFGHGGGSTYRPSGFAKKGRRGG